MNLQKLFYLREAFKNSKLSQSKLKSLQNKKFLEIINYSYKNVNYYRNLWKKLGIEIKKINGVQDIKKIPPINKKIVLKNYKNFISNEYRRYLKLLHKMPSFIFMRSTSGTSGMPFKIYFNPVAKDYLDAIYGRALLKVGYNPTKSLLYYWWQQTPQKESYHLFNLYRKICVPFVLNEEEQLRTIQTIKPEYIYYYPSALYFMSRMILCQNIELGFNPKLIVSHAEINSETMRKTIENAFNTNVYDQYDSNEFSVIAWECKERNGYHINVDSVIVEIVDDNYDEVGCGEVGKVLITGLISRAMPLIRYEIGDFAIKTEENQTKHTCGINLPVAIKSIEGRYEHSEFKKNRIVTQKSLLEKFLSLINTERNLFKLQILVNSKNKKIIVNYNTFGNNETLEKVFNKTSLNGYKVLFKKVKDIRKNELTGKTLLLESKFS